MQYSRGGCCQCNFMHMKPQVYLTVRVQFAILPSLFFIFRLPLNEHCCCFFFNRTACTRSTCSNNTTNYTNFWMEETFINPHWGCCCCCCNYVILAAVSFVVAVAIFAAEMTSCSCLRLSFKCLINSNAAERTKTLY